MVDVAEAVVAVLIDDDIKNECLGLWRNWQTQGT